MQKSDSIKAIAANLIKFRRALKQPSKEADNPFFKSKYVVLEGVVKAIDDALKDINMTYMQEATSDGNQVSVSTILLDESGEYIQFEPLSVPVSKNDAQAFGSAETYARRYTLSAVFGVTSDIDDDGNAASKNAPKEAPHNNWNGHQASPNKQASDKQVKMIHAQFGIAAKRNNQDQRQLEHEFLIKKQLSDFRDMTSKTASDLIGALKAKNDAEDKAQGNEQIA
ncbi:ERF family protein [Lactiplantibacillus plantarum]|uniref:ERF family protein n=1 Tax=Lactiplantibacillus plantarum TaxID=1590 RepID=UPI001401E5FA|nr:ERF family protein [Lactiplantibacillus plantarum]